MWMQNPSLPLPSLTLVPCLHGWRENRQLFFASLNIEMCLFSFQRETFTGLKEGSIAFVYVGRLSELGKRERRGDNRRKVRRMHRRRQNLLSFFYFVVATAEILALLQGHSRKKARKFLSFGKYESAHFHYSQEKRGFGTEV